MDVIQFECEYLPIAPAANGLPTYSMENENGNQLIEMKKCSGQEQQNRIEV